MKRITEQDKQEFRAFCEQATISQLLEIYRKEKAANRRAYARIAETLILTVLKTEAAPCSLIARALLERLTGLDTESKP